VYSVRSLVQRGRHQKGAHSDAYSTAHDTAEWPSGVKKLDTDGEELSCADGGPNAKHWAEALTLATRLYNLTPHEKFLGKETKIQDLRTFGCKTYSQL
jgi:hypothetical protein